MQMDLVNQIAEPAARINCNGFDRKENCTKGLTHSVSGAGCSRGRAPRQRSHDNSVANNTYSCGSLQGIAAMAKRLVSIKQTIEFEHYLVAYARKQKLPGTRAPCCLKRARTAHLHFSLYSTAPLLLLSGEMRHRNGPLVFPCCQCPPACKERSM